MNQKNKAVDTIRKMISGKKPQASAPSLWGRYSFDASHLVKWFDFDEEDLIASRNLMDKHDEAIKIQHVVWFIPEFDNPFWGGIHTILRFASYLKMHKNIRNSFVIIGNVSEEHINKLMHQAFPNLRDEKLYILLSESEMSKIEESDASICTLWTTAYHLLKFNNTKRKFYFMQDFEPLFYPAGSTSAQVEETYRFGFYGIANTVSLKQIYEQQYRGNAESFTPAVDTSIFYPSKERKNIEPFTVFFYGRPGHPRNGFELGMAALRKLKKNMGDRVRIVTAGANWSSIEFGLDEIIENLGLLSYRETADLYRKCDAALSMMFTRHPSYIPLELMASGCLVVTNKNPATSWLLQDKVNCLLSDASASCLADTLEKGLLDFEERQRIANRSVSMIQENFSDWDSEFEKIYSYMRDPQDNRP